MYYKMDGYAHLFEITLDRALLKEKL